MAQRVWHSLPIWVTSSRASPTCRRVPIGRLTRSIPLVVMFSAKSPAFTSSPMARILSMLSCASRLTWRCQSPAWPSPTMPWFSRSSTASTGFLRSPLFSLMQTASTCAIYLSPYLRHGEILMCVAILRYVVPLGLGGNDEPQNLRQPLPIRRPQPGEQVCFRIAEQAALGLAGGGDPDAVAFAAEMARYGGDDADAAPSPGDAKIP